jgi:hypothetical protein
MGEKKTNPSISRKNDLKKWRMTYLKLESAGFGIVLDFVFEQSHGQSVGFL